MSTLFIDRSKISLEHDAGALIVRDQGQRIATIPLAPISRVILRGSAQLSASVLAQLGQRGIGVIILSARTSQPTLFFGRPHNDASLRVAQSRASLDTDFCLRYASHLVRRKIQGQIDCCEQLRQERPQHNYPLSVALRQLKQPLIDAPHAHSLGTLRGLEGAAANTYFAALQALVPESWGFKDRNRRPPRDPFNVLLSLTYTLAHAEAAFALHAAGLDPCIGFYHQLLFKRESLACDVVEIVRPLVDAFCLQLVAKQTLTADHFSTGSTPGAACILGKAGRSRYYPAYEADFAPAMRAVIKDEIKSLVRRIAPDLPEPADFQPEWLPTPYQNHNPELDEEASPN